MLKRITAHLPDRAARHRRSAVWGLVAAVAVLLVQVVLSTVPAHAAGLYYCPGGSSSGGNNGSCSTIYNNDLVSERPLPAQVYRGDSRQPYDIFRQGFTAVGTDYDIPRHVHGGSSVESGYVSTSAVQSIAETFARGSGMRTLYATAAQPQCRAGRFAQWSPVPGIGWWQTEDCEGRWVTADTYVYVIDSRVARNAVYIPDQIRGDPSLERFAAQDEWAYFRHIPNTAVVGVRVYRMRGYFNYAQGQFAGSSITFTYDRFMGNSAYNEAQISYDPANDPNAHFNSTTPLDVPDLPANPYTRGCEAIERCR